MYLSPANPLSHDSISPKGKVGQAGVRPHRGAGVRSWSSEDSDPGADQRATGETEDTRTSRSAWCLVDGGSNKEAQNNLNSLVLIAHFPKYQGDFIPIEMLEPLSREG